MNKKGVLFSCIRMGIALLMLFAFVPLLNTAYAVRQPVGALQEEDFSYKGIKLLDDEKVLLENEAMNKELLFDTDMYYMGRDVKRYTYDNDVWFYVSEDTHEIVEILVRDKKYVARNGVTYGALNYSLIKNYGYPKKQKLAGQTCYVYNNPEIPDKTLVVEVESENFYLIGMRMTVLPLEEPDMFRPIDTSMDNEFNGTHFKFGANAKATI